LAHRSLTATAGGLGLIAVAVGVAALVWGDASSLEPSASSSWPERYGALRPLVQHQPRLGYWGNRHGFFRAQYVLAPTVLSWENPSHPWQGRHRDAPPPTLVIVDLPDGAARQAGLEWLRGSAERRGDTATVLAGPPGFALVEFASGADQ
jgi:hypothetical protein